MQGQRHKLREIRPERMKTFLENRKPYYLGTVGWQADFVKNHFQKNSLLSDTLI